MAINLLKRAIIEAAISKGLHDIKNDPKRGIRNLVDLGIHFAKGDFQKSILNMIQGVLSNLDSSYYNVVSDIIDNIDHNIIKTFGMNIGFNSWTEGVKRIRHHKQKFGYSVPWVVIFDFRATGVLAVDKLSNVEICDIISRGKKLGIYSYVFFVDDSVEDLLEVVERNPDCAFVIYVPPELLTRENVHHLKSQGNVVFSVLFDQNADEEGLSQAIEFLSEDKCLFAVHSYYNDQKVDWILSDRWIKEVEKLPCMFAFLIQEEQCSDENAKKVIDYIYSSRTERQHNIFLMDFYGDIAYINCIVSSDSFFLTIEENGDTLIRNGGEEISFNIRTMNLTDILSKSAKAMD